MTVYVEPMSKQEKAMVKEALKTFEQFDEFNDIVSKAMAVSRKLKASKHCVVFTGTLYIFKIIY